MSRLSDETVKYAIVGLINTVGGLLLIYVCMAAGLGDILANVIGYAAGLIFSFFLNGRWTFGRATLSPQDLAQFLTVTIMAYAINLLAMLSVRDMLEWGSHIAQLAGVGAYAIVGFIGMKLLAFKD